MKKFICALLSVVFIASLLSSCGELKEPPKIGFLVADQFSGYKLGTVADLVPEKVITDNIDSPDVVTFSSVKKGLRALSGKKIHGFVLPAVYAEAELEKSPDFAKLEMTFIEKNICGICSADPSIYMLVEAGITSLKHFETDKKIARAYSPYANDGDPYVRPENYEKLNGAKLTVGICSDEAYPYNFHEDGKLTGVNVDVAHELAKYMKAELVIKEYAEDDLLTAFNSGEVDLVLSEFTHKWGDENKEGYYYTEPYYDASTLILIRSPLADLKK